MKRLSISLLNKSPFSIATSRSVGNVQESLDFIRGTLIRGALASTWIKKNKNNINTTFKIIFTEEEVAFTNLYFKGANPIPFSAQTCKYESGFKGDSDSNKDIIKHRVYDILLSRIRENENRVPIPDDFEHCHFSGCCKQSLAPMKKYRGYYLWDHFKGAFITGKVQKRLVYHTAISHLSEAPLEKTLYSQEVVESYQTFRGDILVYNDDLLSELMDLINEIKIIYIGSDKSTGLGKFEVISLETVEMPDIQNLKERISIFNNKLDINNGKTYFCVTLLSDAIVTDKYMRYKSFIEKDDINIGDAELILGIAETVPVQGWNSMAKIPKEDMIAIEKGSVFVFSTNKLDDILNDLYDAEVYGIGKRRGEGFGRLAVCDPFHFQDGPI